MMTSRDEQPAAGFGRPIASGRSAKDRMQDQSGVPDGYPKGAAQRREEELNKILKGEVPESGRKPADNL